MRWLILSTVALSLILGCDDGDEASPAQADMGLGGGGGGEAGGEDVDPEGLPCVGKCDWIGEAPIESRYVVDLDVVNQIWPGAQPVTHVDQLFSVLINLPTGQVLRAASHLFGAPVNVIPYHDEDGEQVIDAAGQPVIQGDAELSIFFPPGSIGYAIKHHRPAHRVLDFGALAQGAGADALKEDMKLQDTHIELVVGVERPLGDQQVNGVITLNNPQNYQRGRFGSADYPMIFVRPAFPDYLEDVSLHLAFEDNIRTMMLAFNAVSTFPGDYNGGDPLAAWSPGLVREHTRQMVLAVAGEGPAQADAVAFFQSQAHMIYCAELGHVATSAGLLVPINRAGLVESGLISEATYQRFIDILTAHNDGLRTPLTERNDNSYAQYVKAAIAPEDLRPLPTYAGAAQADEEARLAFRPLTMPEIVEGFLKTHIPRNDARLGGEQLAPVQGAVLQALKPGLMEAMGMDDSLYVSMVDRATAEVQALEEDLLEPELSEITRGILREQAQAARARQAEAKAQLEVVRAKRAAIDGFYNQLVALVATPHESYEAFRAALAPLMTQARGIAGPRDDSGAGLFVPPSALHLVAQRSCDGDDRCGGLIGLNYVGHGFHMSAVRLVEPPPPPPPVAIVTLTQVMPRPGADYNGDGVFDPRQDEYAVLHNMGTGAQDLTGWSLSDDVKTRHEFDGVTLQPGEMIFIFGGAVEGFTLSNDVISRGLGLNDTGDALTLWDANGQPQGRLAWPRVAVDQLITQADICAEGQQQIAACGVEGVQRRGCANGLWGAWGACVEAASLLDACAEVGAPAPLMAGEYVIDNTPMGNRYPASCGMGAQGGEVALAFTASHSGRAHLRTINTTLDTVLHLRRGACAEGEEIACNDDIDGVLQSGLSVELVEGEVYHLFIDTYSINHVGPITLTVAFDAE
ncbi:lamin tail domain-containing protein [Myxococcota bacterium]|nr:lamin tail domain-containing protein [Myxococcota bacterium]